MNITKKKITVQVSNRLIMNFVIKHTYQKDFCPSVPALILTPGNWCAEKSGGTSKYCAVLHKRVSSAPRDGALMTENKLTIISEQGSLSRAA